MHRRVKKLVQSEKINPCREKLGHKTSENGKCHDSCGAMAARKASAPSFTSQTRPRPSEPAYHHRAGPDLV
jgi:hypothetical protein